MKKNHIIISTMVVLTPVLCINFNRESANTLLEANVEALAHVETIQPEGYVQCYHHTEDDGTPGYYLVVRECLNCNEVAATKVSRSDTCML